MAPKYLSLSNAPACGRPPTHSWRTVKPSRQPLKRVVIVETEGSARITSMKRRTLLQSIPALALLGKAAYAQQAGSGQKSTAVYELRVYHTYEGKLDDLLTRFREHTMRLFEKHGMKNIAYWTPTDDPLKGKTLFYVIAHPSREAATANWKAFG